MMLFQQVALYAFEGERVLVRIFFAAMIAHFVRCAWRARRLPRLLPPAPPAVWPVVTVQLPLCDEPEVAERVIRGAAALDYPREQLEIQVLDDSRELHSQAVVDGVVAEVAAEGAPVTLVRRGDRWGFKAGNLRKGMETARGSLLAVFDADAVPPQDFLRQLVPYLTADPNLAMVQGTASFLNRGHSALTRAQALILDGLMAVEQEGQARRHRPFHFNGSGGVWRRSSIEAVGGWPTGSITEDFDISYRVQLAGYRLEHLAQVTVPGELPETMAAFRGQQYRWTAGKIQVLRSLGGAILRGPLPWRARVDLLLGGTTRLLHVFCAILLFFLPFTTFHWFRILVKYPIASDALVLGAVMAGAAWYFTEACRARRRPMREAILLTPVVTALVIGQSLLCTVAVVSALLGRPQEFIRTAKGGAAPSARRDALPWVEVLVAIAYVGFAWHAAPRNPATAAFMAFVAMSFLWTGLGTLLSPLQRGASRTRGVPELGGAAASPKPVK